MRALLAAAAAVIAALAVLAGCGSSTRHPAPPENFPSAGEQSGHEKITRFALECHYGSGVDLCWGDPGRPGALSKSLNVLAGYSGFRGAAEQELNRAAAHCDNADYNIVNVKTYPQTETEAHDHLQNCIDVIDARLSLAMRLARKLVNPDGTLAPATNLEIPGTKGTCSFPEDTPPRGGNPDDVMALKGATNAKCSVINQLGRAMHTMQDFFAHSNWADYGLGQNPAKPPGPDNVDPTKQLSNPPGLGRTCDWRSTIPKPANCLPDFFQIKCENKDTNFYFDRGRQAGGSATYPKPTCFAPSRPPTITRYLITGCDNTTSGGGTAACTGRIVHSGEAAKYGINKDSYKTLDTSTCKVTGPGNRRGQTEVDAGDNIAGIGKVSNAQRAVWDACIQVRQTWIQFRRGLHDVYGLRDGNLMACAIARDNPAAECK